MSGPDTELLSGEGPGSDKDASAPRPPPALLMPWVESPFFERELTARRSTLTDKQVEIARTYHDLGYVAIEQAIPHELCDRIRQQVEPMCDDPYAIENRRVPDAWSRGADAVLELARSFEIQDLIARLYGRKPIPFQTLNFKYGTQQELHSDAIHFTCLPARYMCGVWVALEDVDEGNGPLLYYPGSHRVSDLTPYDIGLSADDLHFNRHESVWHELMKDLGLKPVEYHAKKGDVLIWSSNILHGGKRVTREGSTRWSQVTHYYFENCIYYSPIYSDLFPGEYHLRQVTDLNTMEAVTPTYDGIPLHIEPIADGRSRLSLARGGLSPASASEESAESSENRVKELEKALTSARAEAEATKSTASYRLGHALLKPVRALRRED